MSKKGLGILAVLAVIVIGVIVLTSMARPTTRPNGPRHRTTQLRMNWLKRRRSSQ